ncbi:MAG: ABC transporter ATP-binding protein [Chloroflexota bacterium]
MMLLDVRHVSKSFSEETTAVSQASLTIDEGEIVCLLGPSGCGKTTLLRMIAGLEKQDEGEIWFDSRCIDPVPPHKRDFGMMFQEYALFPHKNVFQNIAFGLQMRRDSQKEIDVRVAEMLALVELEGFGERDISQLSGGERQRVALARSLAPGPRLLMLDEPLGALDRALRERLMVDLRGILKRVGVTAVYVTHDQTEAFAIADRIVVMNASKIERVDTPEAVYERPGTPFVARFLGFENVLAAEVVTAGVVGTAVGEFQLETGKTAVGSAVSLLIKPQALAELDAEIEAGINVLNGRLHTTTFRGRYYQLWIQPEGSDKMLMLESKTRPAPSLTCFPLRGDKIQLLG